MAKYLDLNLRHDPRPVVNGQDARCPSCGRDARHPDYRVYMSETLDLASFRAFGDVLNGIDGEMTVSLPVGASPSAFYRVRDETP